MTPHQQYMYRCLELAKRGAGAVAPNPVVGAVLVHEKKIIGEGFHRVYGGPHAEVNCIDSVAEEDKDLIGRSTLYVSLEPCAHHGKTPPCTALILHHKIKKVVIGCRDPFEEVNGKGIEKLKEAGVEIELGVLEKECRELNKRFITFHVLKRPYVVLKWAQTRDGFMAPIGPAPVGTADSAICRLMISNEYSNRLVHRWRSEEAAILVGTQTALLDDPQLTNRLWPGTSPVRLVVDMNLRLPSHLKIFDQRVRTIVFNKTKQEEHGNLLYYKLAGNANLVREMMQALYQLNIQSLLVEGGARLLQSFIDEEIWDELRVIINEELIINSGLPAPALSNAVKISEQKIFSDKIEIYKFNG